MYLSISANGFARRFVCSPAPANPMSRFSPTKEALEDWAESNRVTESWALRIRDEARLSCRAFATSRSCFCLTYWVAFPRNMMLFSTLTDVRLCRGQDGKLNQVFDRQMKYLVLKKNGYVTQALAILDSASRKTKNLIISKHDCPHGKLKFVSPGTSCFLRRSRGKYWGGGRIKIRCFF